MAGHVGEDRRADILDRIRAIPEGFVRSYGDLSPGAPRYAAMVLSQGHPDDVPWHRVVRSDGSIVTHPPARQRALLEAEGVPFRGERVDMRIARIP
jgi:alkylated DNA nucleotide flippase Atl1